MIRFTFVTALAAGQRRTEKWPRVEAGSVEATAWAGMRPAIRGRSCRGRALDGLERDGGRMDKTYNEVWVSDPRE